MSAAVWLAAAALGGTGAVARLLVDGAVSARAGGAFPYGTLGVNLSGAFVLGLLTGLHVTGDALELAGTAFLGSYTTFSTWMYESQRLVEGGEPGPAAGNVALSLAAGLAVVAAGRVLGGAL